MSIYAQANYQVRDDLAAIHASQLQELGRPGTWGTGTQRLAVAMLARKTAVEAGLLEQPENVSAAVDLELPDVVGTLVREIAIDTKDLSEDTYNRARSGGLSDEEYVEIVGIVSRMVNFDIFARGIGVPLVRLPDAVPGGPSRERPETARREHAWVPTVPNPPEGGKDADELYGGHQRPYIMRALSLVPGELLRHLELEEVQYLPLSQVLVADYQHHDGLTRAQVEVVAGRVSAINECFF